MSQLRPLVSYQQEILNRFLETDQMGLQLQQRLGKTLITCHWVQSRKFRRPLIVCPISANEEWLANIPNAELITYQKISRNPSIIDPSEYDALILDESSAIKNAKSACTKAILKKAKGFRGRAILTGILVPESMEDVYCQLTFLRGGSFMGCQTFWHWRQMYFVQDGYDYNPKLGTIPVIKAEIAASCAILSRKEARVGSEKRRRSIACPMSPEIEKVYRTLSNQWRLPNGIETKYAPVAAGWLHRASGGHHKPDVELPCDKYDIVADFARTNSHLVVWCSYSLELRRMWRHLKAANIACTFIQGKTPRSVRAERRKRFFEMKRCVMIAQPVCARFGLDLSKADVAVYLSCPWSHNTRLQSEDRIIHPFKTDPVTVYDLTMDGSVDADVLEAVLEKRDVTQSLIGRGYVQSF